MVQVRRRNDWIIEEFTPKWDITALVKAGAALQNAWEPEMKADYWQVTIKVTGFLGICITKQGNQSSQTERGPDWMGDKHSTIGSLKDLVKQSSVQLNIHT